MYAKMQKLLIENKSALINFSRKQKEIENMQRVSLVEDNELLSIGDDEPKPGKKSNPIFNRMKIIVCRLFLVYALELVPTTK